MSGTAATDGRVLKHARLRALLLEQVGSTWQAHAAIPSERELMAAHGVSRATVREAIGRLVEEQVLYRVHGRGTFVAGPRVQSTLHLASFTQDMRRRGLQPSTILRSARLERSTAEVRTALALDSGAPAWRVERLRLAGGVPMALEVAWYSPAVLPDLGDQDLTGSLYALLGEAYGVRIERAEQTAWAEAADVALAEPLGVDAGAPLLVFRRTSATGDGRAVEHVTSWYRGDRYQVHMSLTDRLHPTRTPVSGSSAR
ncbi:GntR family transcriptional regulator [Serinibacter arcticus]|nr:GntR family transcriptional regulator [Serinibacter arcticus]